MLRTMYRLLGVLAVVLPMGCADSERIVATLDEQDQIQLCEEFRAALCTHAMFAADCAMSCWRTCEDAALGAITAECTADPGSPPITDAQVLECATAGTVAACEPGSGCMIDALESACP